MIPRYSKSEIIERFYRVNNFRIYLGAVFFLSLVFLDVFSVTVSENVFVLLVAGLSVLFYGLLTFYYLKTQKIALSEVVFLSTFLGVVDLLAITVFVYFSGGHESLFLAGYFIFVAVVPFWAPYFPRAPLFWALMAAAFYDLLLLLIVSGFIPHISLRRGAPILDNHFEHYLINAILAPAVLILFALAEVSIVNFLGRERSKLESEVDLERAREKQFASFASVFWALTHVLSFDRMLGEALDKILEVLSLRSGLVLLLDPQKGAVCAAEKGLPAEVIAAIKGKQVREVDDIFKNLEGIFLGKEFIQKDFVVKLMFHRRTVGFLILFSRGEGRCVSPGLKEMLDAVADEMAAAIYYGKLFRRIKRK